MRRLLDNILPPLVLLMLLGVAAELYVRLRDVPMYLFPAPSAVLQAMYKTRDSLLSSLGHTALAAGLGFGASVVAGVLLAVFLSSSSLVRRAFYPYTVLFQTIPVVAVAPLLVIWFEAGLTSVAICAFMVSVFPVITNTLAGLLSTDPALRDLFRLYGAGPVGGFIKLRLPSALPNIFTGLRVAAGLSVIGTIVGEFVVGDLGNEAGLGILIKAEAGYGNTDRVFAAIVLASLLGVVMLMLISLVANVMLRRWHASER